MWTRESPVLDPIERPALHRFTQNVDDTISLVSIKPVLKVNRVLNSANRKRDCVHKCATLPLGLLGAPCFCSAFASKALNLMFALR